MTGVTNTELALAIQQVIARVDAREDELKVWQSGPFDGGPFGDGRYQITNLMGEVGYFKSPARLAYEVGLLTTSAEGALAQVLAAQDAVEASLATVEARATAATGAATTATTKAAEADTFRQQAANSEANSLVHRNAAQSAASSAASDRAAAVSARDAAQLAQTGAQVARADAQTFRNEAQVARDQAQAFAASINPATLATKAELQAELNALIGAAPGTLNTLNELATALGNDPNFAATITAQIAGKANTVHTHTIAQITGLQTALDGKSNVGHTHVIADVTGLQAALDGKLGLDGGFLTGPLSAVSNLIVRGGTVGAMGSYLSFRDSGNTERGWVGFGEGSNVMRVRNTLGELRLESEGGQPVKINSRDVLSEIDGKAALSHTHSISQVTGLQSALDAKLATASFTWTNLSGKPSTFTPSAHTHSISEVTGLQAALDGKQAAGSYAAASHTHAISDVSGLQAALDGKAATSHTHTIAQVTGLQAALDGKASLSHTHAISEVSGLQSAIDARVPWSEYNGAGRQLLQANGYQRLPGGLILQWGSVFITGNGSVNVTFPLAFPNACFIAMADGGETVTNRQDNGPAVTSYNNFTVSITNGIDVGISTRWFAIGW